MKRAVRGRLSVAASERALKIILTTDRESAVASVTAAEIGSSREPETIKALSVVVRTFMLLTKAGTRTKVSIFVIRLTASFTEANQTSLPKSLRPLFKLRSLGPKANI